MRKRLSAADCAAILKGGDFEEFITAMEGDEFEAKAEPYRLEDKRQKFELAKDVSSFANARGGVIIIGLETERDPVLSGDIVTKWRLIDERTINIAQYQDVLNSWPYPSLQTTPEIKWFPSLADRSKGVVAISITNQPGQWRPFLITKSVEPDGTQSATMFGYAERRLDRSEPMGVQQLHLLIRDGLRTETETIQVQQVDVPKPAQVPPIPISGRETRPAASQQDSQDTRDAACTGELFKDIGPKRIEGALKTANLDGGPAFVLAAMPDQPTDIPDLFVRRSNVVKIMEDPRHLRYGGFSPDAGSDSRIIRGELRRTLIPSHRILELWRDGTLIFAEIGNEDGLSWGSKLPDAYKINQLALIETTLQFVTLAHDIFSHARPAPTQIKFWIELRRLVKVSNNPVLSSGIVHDFGTGERKPAPNHTGGWSIMASPDETDGRTVFRLIAEVYRWFSFDDDDIPYTEESSKGKIVSQQMIIDLHKK
jgi:schlafen family protein